MIVLLLNQRLEVLLLPLWLRLGPSTHQNLTTCRRSCWERSAVALLCISQNRNSVLNTRQEATVSTVTCLGFALQRGFDSLDPFIPVSVPNYSEKEFESCYLYYTDRRWLQHPQCKWEQMICRGDPRVNLFNWLSFFVFFHPSGHTEEGKKELIFLSNRNPSTFDRVCAPL